MSTTYRLSYVYMDYSHEDTIEISTDKESIVERYETFISDTLKENDPEDDAIDYLFIADENENIIFEYDFNG